uniref:DUF4350 domain-containing protein n=1 Tax=Ignisphaera aggregans TaxID=334771 RepID=A0A7J3I8A0_9CREN
MLNRLKRLRTGRDFILMLMFTILVSSMSVLINMPSTSPYSPYNVGDRGYTQLTSLTLGTAKFIKDLKNLEQKALIIIPLNSKPDSSLPQLIENLLENEATVVILDEDGYSNDLMRYFELKAKIDPVKVLDEVSKVRSREYPLADIKFGDTVFEVVTYKPSHIVIDEENCFIIAKTSRYAYADIDNNGYYSIGESMDEYIIGCGWRKRNGYLWLISDLDIFTNELISLKDNLEFLGRLVSLGKVYLVIDYLGLGSIDVSKYLLNELALGVTTWGNISIALLVYLIILVASVMMKYAEKH